MKQSEIWFWIFQANATQPPIVSGSLIFQHRSQNYERVCERDTQMDAASQLGTGIFNFQSNVKIYNGIAYVARATFTSSKTWNYIRVGGLVWAKKRIETGEKRVVILDILWYRTWDVIWHVVACSVCIRSTYISLKNWCIDWQSRDEQDLYRQL